MSNINQLLAKAMSTTSEEEAMTCLRMARKKGKTFESNTADTYKDQNAKYWYDKAHHYYNEVKRREGGLTQEQQRHLWNMFKDCEADVASLKFEKKKLEEQIRVLQAKPNGWWKLPVIAGQAVIIILLLQMIG